MIHKGIVTIGYNLCSRVMAGLPPEANKLVTLIAGATNCVYWYLKASKFGFNCMDDEM